MKPFVLLTLGVLFAIPALYPQSALIPKADKPVWFDVSPPLRDMFRTTARPDRSWKSFVVVPNKFNNDISEGQGALAPPDPIRQTASGYLLTDTTIANFNGIGAGGSVPPDTYGEAGPDYYFQVVNTSYAIFNKTGELIFGPYPNSSVWAGMPNNDNSGDAVVLYDEAANRWLFSQFSLPNYPAGPFYQMIAVSQTGDPMGSWHRYQYEFSLMPDYPKFGVWHDGYYMSSNNFGNQGFENNGAYAFDRIAMLNGEPDAIRISFTLVAGGGGFNTLYPADCDGELPPAGTPNYFGFIKRNDTQYFGIYEFQADFADPASSAFGNLQQVTVTPFTSQLNGIPQLGTDRKLETLSDRLMYRLQYRRFNGHNAMVANHTVNVGSDVAGVRWYEFRKGTGSWTLQQEGTYAPSDGHSRWMGSIAMDSAGSIALGYSISSAAIYPGIRYTGRLKNDPPGVMSIAEKAIIHGGGCQTGIWSGRSRWGDYSGMSVDPANPTTFWYTTEYYASTSNSGWSTRVGSFTFENVFSTYASGTPAKLCAGTDTVQLNATAYGGSGTYTWSWSSIPSGFTSNLQNPVVVPQDTTRYIVATSDGSAVRTDTVLVKVVFPPVVNAGNDTLICAWQTSVDLYGYAANFRNFVWGSFGDGDFSDPYAMETTYFPGNEDRMNGGVDLLMLAFAQEPCSGKVMDTLHLTIDACTGIGQEDANGVRVSVTPNPASGSARVLITGIDGLSCMLSISGVEGKIRYTEAMAADGGTARTTLDLTGYPAGVYFLHIRTRAGETVRKMIVE